MPSTSYDSTTPEHKRGVIKVLLFVGVMGAIGGAILGYKISSVEAVSAETSVDARLSPAANPAASPDGSPRR